MDEPVAPSQRPPWSVGRRALRSFVWSAVALLLLGVAAAAFLSSQLALELAIARALAASEGRLTIQGAEGSLLSTVRVARIAWRGDDVDVEAENMALTWSASGLISRQVNITGLGAHRIAMTIKGAGGPLTMPANLALPLEVNIANVGVERFEWRVGPRSGTITGLVFDYTGGAHTHAVRKLHLVTNVGTFTGDAQIAAEAPFALQGNLDFVGDGSFRDTRAGIVTKGTLAQFELAAKGTSRDAGVNATATLTPFSPSPLVAAHIEARDVDIARFAASLPATRLAVAIDAKPAGDGFAGTLSTQNANAGTIDAGRVPLTAMAARFSWDSRELQLDDIDAQLAADARVTGRATLNSDGAPSRWQLAVRNLDLRRVHSTLVATRLSGTLGAEVSGARQVVRGDLTQADLSVNFAATVVGRRIDIERFRGRAGAGEVSGRGQVALDGERAFDLSAQAHELDPSRLGNFPAATLDGTLVARGRLLPTWSVGTDMKVAAGSRWEGVPVSGTLHADVTATTLRNLDARVAFATSTATASGAFGTPGDKLAFSADVVKLSDLRPALAKYAKFAVPETLAGKVHVKGQVTSEPGGNGMDLDAHGEDLQWGKLLRAASLDLKSSIAPGGITLAAEANASRGIKLALTAAHIAGPQGELAAITASADGTLAHHTLALAFSGENMDTRLHFTGALRDSVGNTAGNSVGNTGGNSVDNTRATPLAWTGSLDTLENRGAYALKLDAPAPIEWSRGQLHIGAAGLQVAEGHAKLEDLNWEEGKLSTRGAFDGIPVAALMRIAGLKMPLASTLIISGDWAVAATPQLNGTLHVRREKGDLYGTESSSAATAGVALGISTLEIEGKFVDDSVIGTGTLRSLRAGNADLRLDIAASPTLGTIHSPLTASLVADLPSLRPLQPWLGTLAVIDGRARIEMSAKGSLAKPVLEGTLNADEVRLDVPQYGVRWQDGRLRARIVDNTVELTDLSFAGGDGRFTAKGTLARVTRDGASNALPQAQVTWTADKFRAINRPDFQLTVGGKGVAAVENGKLALRGNVNIVQGRIDYEPSSVGTLSSDVVIVGRPRGAANANAALDVPLVLELDVDLGDDLRFTGEGLDTELVGKLRLGTAANGALTARGTISAINGTYFIFGQRLEIDRGQLIFDGPADNPAIDVVALRRNLSVEAGVEVTGNVRLPRVRLVSSPPVPDGEKLSWLMTGQGLDRASRADLAALGAASASLLGRGQRPLTTTIANSIGLDDISLRERSNAVTSGTTSQVVAFGKRINDRLTLVYEQGLTVANNALRIEYALTRTLTLRAEAGVISSLGLYFRRSYD
jgi:translocation and assembly module TamB